MTKAMPIKNYQSFWLLTLAFVTLCYIPRISEKGMFIDGLVYTTLAHNLSEGVGTFWQPILKNSEFLFQQNNVFYDHPPLVFGIESIFYKLFGDQTEWIYNTFILLLLLFVLVLLFRLFEPEKNLGILLGFLPIFFLFTIPELIQKISYNLLDTTLAVFTSFAVYFLLRAVHRPTHFLIYSSLGGILTVLAFLTKGPVGLFPLATPFLYFLFYSGYQQWRKPLMATIVITLILIAAASILYAYHPSREFFDHYLNQQVLASMKGEREKANTIYNHLSIFKKIGIQLSPILILTALIWFVRRKTVNTPNTLKKPALLFLVIALSASLPIALSAKHHSFYLFPSFIFFVLAFSSFLSTLFPTSYLTRIRKINGLISALATVMIVVVTLYSFSRKERYYASHHQLLMEMKSFAPLIPEGSTIGVPEDILHHRGDVCCYLERYYHLELNSPVTCCSYFLTPSSDTTQYTHSNQLIQTKNFYLYHKDDVQ
jgi:4-amino-4-deoxy-L-arabinose transferase-like glycosyltransferase